MFIAITLPPDLFRVTPTFEMRERFERRISPDFNDATSDSRSDLFTRYRIGAKAAISPNLGFEVRYQYAHDWAFTAARTFSTERSDIDLAYVELKQNGWDVTLGRQKIAVVSQRLIGPLEWVNVPRSFDGLRIRRGNWDGWVARIGLSAQMEDQVLTGLTRTDRRLGSTSVISKHDKAAGRSVDILTLNEVISRPLNSFNVEFEGAAQTGRVAGKRLEAWALHGRFSHAIGKKATGYMEANAASGGSDPNVTRTFDNLYPTNHPFYGLMDLQGWRNMNELELGVDYSARKDLGIKAQWHAFSLRDRADAWYRATGATNGWPGGKFLDPSGRSGREVGSELDLEATWQVNRSSNLQAGLGVFDPGRFVRKIRGEADRQSWGYVQYQVRF